MAMKGAWVEALRPLPGSLRLVVLRWMLWILSALPGSAIAVGSMGDGAGRSPYFAEAPDPFPLATLGRWISEVPGLVWIVFSLGALLAWLGNLMLTAAAVEILQPAPAGGVRVWRAFFDSGARHLWSFLRIALLAFMLLVAGGRVLDSIIESAIDHGTVAGWTAERLRWTLPLIRLALLVGWATVVGVLAWWCRVITVAGGRRYVRRLPALVLRVWCRAPMQGLVLQVALALLGLFAGAAALFAWRQSSFPTGPWLLLWLGVLLLQSCLWHWRLRTCCLIWADPVCSAPRGLPDEPWRWIRRMASRSRRRPRPENSVEVAEAATVSAPGSNSAPR